MSIEILKSNIARAKEIIKEMNIFSNQLKHIKQLESQGMPVNKREKALLQRANITLRTQLSIINEAIPDILDNIGFYKKLGEKSPVKSKKLLEVKYNHSKGETKVAIPKSKEKKFTESVTSEQEAGKLKEEAKEKPAAEIKKSSIYIKYSNKFFRDYANNMIKKGYFSSLNTELRKITSPIILGSYIAMALFSTLLSFFIGIFIMIIMLLLGAPILVSILVLIVLPVLTFLLFYNYPSSQRKTLEKEINQELPFVTIYMSAIATSGIEPSKIFNILISTKDYPFTQREVKKLLNYINFYGYDLVSALKYVAKNNPSERFAMLMNGMATTITTGGELTDFLDKHSETLLFDYRLEREKYTKVAETFMDIYISVVIAAPMIMMMLFVLLSLTGFGGAFLTPAVLSTAIVFVVSALNVIFLLFINMKQPKF